MRRLILTCIGIFSFTFYVWAQNDCHCRNTFDKMLQKISENYIGYRLTKDDTGKKFNKLIKKYKVKAENADKENCAFLLNEFLRFFKDGHLFVSEYPEFDSIELSGYKKKVREGIYNIQSITDYLGNPKEKLSAIEGVWTDGKQNFAVVRNKVPAWHYEFVAIVLSSTEPDKSGEIKFGVNLKNDRYEGTYYTNAYAPRYVSVKPLKENSMLSIWGGILWGRVPVQDLNSPSIASLKNPSLPVITKKDDETTLLTIPSFLIEKRELDKVLLDNLTLLQNTRYLVIDIRGNNGGNGIYFDIISLYAHKPLYSDTGWALSSPDNMAYFQRFAGRGTNNPYTPVVEDMKNNTAQVVKGPRFKPLTLKPVESKIEKVVILTDEANISAAETFILYSKASSDKVITVGKNTGGVVDYNNINMIKIDCGKGGIHLGYPTYTRTSRVPLEGYNKTGIRPDIYTEKKSDELYRFIHEILKK